ncbi:MAG: hypothetical protein H0W40_15765 [Methylibium sp.]|nr:hypothetical protein [Methylibium sp.]MBA3598814.1 hypothetical protein [Methylibium sp.]
MSTKKLFEINELPEYDGTLTASWCRSALTGAVVEFGNSLWRGLHVDA